MKEQKTDQVKQRATLAEQMAMLPDKWLASTDWVLCVASDLSDEGANMFLGFSGNRRIIEAMMATALTRVEAAFDAGAEAGRLN